MNLAQGSFQMQTDHIFCVLHVFQRMQVKQYLISLRLKFISTDLNF